MFDLHTTPLSSAPQAVLAARSYLAIATNKLRAQTFDGDKLNAKRADAAQRAVHGLAWLATVVETMSSTLDWLHRPETRAKDSEINNLVALIGLGEYLQQILGGIVMGPNELLRPADMGLQAEALALGADPAVAALIAAGNTAETRARLIALIVDGQMPSELLSDDTLDMIRDTFRRFSEERIAPNAHRWHLADDLIPDEIITEMAELGAFGVCIDEDYGGLGLSKMAMCVVTEELSRGWIAAGSLGTRSEIAGEVIGLGGTPAQRSHWLPRIASGEVLPTAVFTEPDTGSDLGSLRSRAVLTPDGWRVQGNKTWITHAARSDVMTLLVRTDPDSRDHNGLSMLIAPKPRGTDETPFPAEGMSGGEIKVLGYRGMKEYELAFTDFLVPAEGLLGGVEGQGFRQLMKTFEGARIQTAARAVGVARTAFDLGLRYAMDRKQFGQAIVGYPRIADKLVMMLVEIVMAREITYYSARAKDQGLRCDIEAGMAKLLAARVAWTNADAALQIHGGNGYSMEFEISRVLCDARILNIFEGAAEIQAHVVGRGLLGRNSLLISHSER